MKRAVEEAESGNLEGPNRFFETEYKINLAVSLNELANLIP